MTKVIPDTNPRNIPNDDYNPFDHRDVKYPNSDIRSAANLIKGSLGSGLLAMPLAMRNSGYIVGLVGTIIIGLICTHCVYIFVGISQELCRIIRKPQLGYAETCEEAFANGPEKIRFLSKSSRIFADCAMFLTYLGTCLVYLVLMAESTKQIVDQYIPDFHLKTEMYCVILLVPVAIISQVKNLKFLAPFSLLSNGLLVVIFGICLYYIFSGSLSFDGRQPVGEPGRFPLYLSTVIFAMEGIGVVMPTENTMAKPTHFLGCPGVLLISMSIVVSLYTLLGFFGYLRFGDDVTGSITLNLPMDEWPAILAKVLIILATYFSFALQYYVCIDITWKYLQPRINEKNTNMAILTIRFLGVLVITAVGVVMPMLEQVISLVGALFFSLLGVILPPVVEIIFRWERGGWFITIKNMLIIIFGFIAMISGCAVTIQQMVEISKN